MQKYISIVHPKMGEDEIGSLIAKGVAGAMFSISHQNYPIALKLIEQVKKLSRKYNRPISLIQDLEADSDPLDIEFGARSGVDFMAAEKLEQLKMARGINKLMGVINKNRSLPKGLRVDSVLSGDFVDPDAEVLGRKDLQLKHLTTPHAKQSILDSLLHFAEHSEASAIAVQDLDLAKALSFRRPKQKIIFAPVDQTLAPKGAIYWGVHPIFMGHDLVSSVRNANLISKGERMMDATDVHHVAIHLIP